MIIELPDGSYVSLFHIVVVTPVFSPPVQSNDIARADTQPRFVVMMEGNHAITIRHNSALSVEQQKQALNMARDEIIKEWNLIYSGPALKEVAN